MLGQRDVRLRNQIGKARIEHHLGSVGELFGGLEQGDVRALPGIRRLGEQAGSPEQARHVHIVPAGVHDRNHDAVPIGRVIRAGIRQPCHFLHGQGIHVGAHEHDRPVSVAQDADDTGRADLLVHVVAEPAQCVGDQGRGLDLLVAELGMLVDRLVEVLLPGSDRLLPRENGRRISVLGHRWSLHTHRCHSTLLTPRCTSAGCTGPPSTATAVRPLP
jgi:hypothetical protein